MSDGDNPKADSDKLLYCSFCGKSQHEVRKLIAGPSVFICDECVSYALILFKKKSKKNRELIRVRSYPYRKKSKTA